MVDPEADVCVLHVDDDRAVAETTAAFLERIDDRFEIASRCSTEEGLDYLADHEVDCVVSDYEMPGRTGVEFLREVREEHPDLPFVLFTGKGSEEVASDAISAGVTDYLQKETNTEQFEVLANRLLNAVEKFRTERALRRYRAYTDDILDAVDDLFFVHDRDGDLVRWNESFREVTGYDDAAIGSMNGVDFVREADRERTTEAIEEVFETGHARLEVPLLTKGGGTIPYEFSAVRVQDPDGEPRLAGIGRDVSERLAREREREERLAFLRTLYDVATDQSLTFETKVSRLLESGHETLGLPYGHLTRIEFGDGPEEGTQTVVQATGDHRLLQPGEASPLSRSYCRRTIEAGGVMSVRDALADGWADDPAYEDFQLGCYIGTTVEVGGEVHGTLFFADGTPRERPFTDAEETYVSLMSRWIGYELELRG